MFNPKVSGIAAGIGFILSFLLGIVTGVGLSLLLIRALIFAALFFALVSAGYGAISMYLPELLDNSGELPGPGSQVDISIGEDEDRDSGISPGTRSFGEGLNEFTENPGDSGENRDSLPENTLDQNSEDGYTEKRSLEDVPRPLQAALPVELDLSSGGVDSVDVLPDFDSMSGAFSAGSVPLGGGGESAMGVSLGGLFDRQGKTSPGKARLEGDFNVQEMASAIQTILKRENKG
ncbi:MAG: hypothetical protein LBR99_05780 [Treponema sp.]|jgi:hypothetical protein|nr:hypothetical protein [Treponema sp.]